MEALYVPPPPNYCSGYGTQITIPDRDAVMKCCYRLNFCNEPVVQQFALRSGARCIGLVFATLSYCDGNTNRSNFRFNAWLKMASSQTKTCYSNFICGYSLLTLLNDVCNIFVFGEYTSKYHSIKGQGGCFSKLLTLRKK